MYGLQIRTMRLVVQKTYMKDKSPKSTRSNCRLYSYIDAAERALVECANNRRMHYEEIAKIIIKKGWYISKADNPARSLYTSIWLDTKHNAHSRFVMEKGWVSLVKWGPPLLQKIDEHVRKEKHVLISALKKMNCYDFENFIAEIVLPNMGFEECRVTQKSRDKGIDVEAQYTMHGSMRIDVKVQVKRYSQAVGVGAVRDLRGSLAVGQQGVIITTAKYTKGAYKTAKEDNKPRICLIDGNQLADILLDMDWPEDVKGVEKETACIIKINEEYFANYGKKDQ